MDKLIHIGLAVGAVVIVALCFAYVIPELFNLHNTGADLAAVGIAAGSLAFGCLAIGYLRRSHGTIERGEDR